MSAGLRLVLAIGLVAALAGGLLVLGELGEEPRKGDELARHGEHLLRHINAKSEVVAELLGGRLTLLQAAARFRDLEETPPDRLAVPRLPGGAADGERHCRAVMRWVDNWLKVQAPEQAAGMAARLEEELRRHRGPDGIIRLPH
jgi:hypothetical protein